VSNHIQNITLSKHHADRHSAVHINALTVHDEPVLPHGGWKSSGFGRFGGMNGYDEFLQTKTVTWME
jgi:acyl-CoA reductase-like NAD-dependent aldehyde dehydrogenase